MEQKDLAQKVIDGVNKEWFCPVTICPLDKSTPTKAKENSN